MKQKYRVPHAMVSIRAIEEERNGTSCSDYNTSSAGEDSCDTVIYMGSGGGHISDRDLTDNERPPSPNTMKIMKLKLSSSEDETTDPIESRFSIPSSSSTCYKNKLMSTHPSPYSNSISNSNATGSSSFKDSNENLNIRLRVLDDVDGEVEEEEIHPKQSSSLPSQQPTQQPTQHQATPQPTKQQPTPPPLVTTKPAGTGERAVNIVAPLVVKESVTQKQQQQQPQIISSSLLPLNSMSKTPSLELQEASLAIDQQPPTMEEVKRNINFIFEAQDPTPCTPLPIISPLNSNSNIEHNVSEKDLRSHEKRIKAYLSDIASPHIEEDEIDGNPASDVERNNRHNKLNSYNRKPTDGYMSDVTSTSIHRQDLLASPAPSSRRRSSSNCRLMNNDGYGSAPEYPKKPVQVVRGMVRKQASLDEPSVMADRLRKMESMKTNKASPLALVNEQKTNETCVDDIHRDSTTTTPKVSHQPVMKIQELTVGRFSCIREEQKLVEVLPLPLEGSLKNKNVTVESNDNETTTTQTNSLANSVIDEDKPPQDILQTASNKAITSSSGKLQNLDHIITVSSVPNFSVAKKPSLSNLPSSPSLSLHRQHMFMNSPGAMIMGVSVDCESPLFGENGSSSRSFIGSPQLSLKYDRAYSGETDTMNSMLSNNSGMIQSPSSVAYDSDASAYDSDASSSSHRYPSGTKKPTRLRYRWSTVYEEGEHERKHQQRGVKTTVVDSEVKPSLMMASPKISLKSTSSSSTSSTSLASRFAKSPKQERKQIASSPLTTTATQETTPTTATISSPIKSPKKFFPSLGSKKSVTNDDSFVSTSTPIINSSLTPLSPKTSSKSKFSILSPRSERKNKKNNKNITPTLEKTEYTQEPTGHIPDQHQSTPDKRMSGYSDTSSGIDSGIHSQTSSLRSGEDIKVDDSTIVREEIRSSRHKLWPFG